MILNISFNLGKINSLMFPHILFDHFSQAVPKIM